MDQQGNGAGDKARRWQARARKGSTSAAEVTRALAWNRQAAWVAANAERVLGRLATSAAS